MNAQLVILKRLDDVCRGLDLNELGDIQWSDGQLLRASTLRAERGDPSGWETFIEHLQAHRCVAWGFRSILEELGWIAYSTEFDRLLLTLPQDAEPLDDSAANQLLDALNPNRRIEATASEPVREGLEAIMYIEEKQDLTGHARIGRVRFSASRKTIYYAGRTLRSLKGASFKANYVDVDSGLEFWISNCKKNGNDSLYPGIVEIDEDAREEYWTRIRKLPENVHLSRYRSEGKYSK